MAKKDFTITEVKEKNRKVSKVNINDDFSLPVAEKLKPEIIKLLEKNDAVDIALNDIKAIDLPGIQLLYSIIKTGKKQNKAVEVKLQISEETKALIEHAGFGSFFN